MPKYVIETTARATIREEWTVEADSAVEAAEKFHAGDGTLVFIKDETLGDETDREIYAMQLGDEYLPDGSWNEDAGQEAA